MIPLAAIDTNALLNVVLVSLAAGIVIIGAYSLALYGGTRVDEVRRQGRALLATVYGAVSILALVVFVAAVVVGAIIMTSK